MPSISAKPANFPRTSIVRPIALGELTAETTRFGVQYWQSQRGDRPFPSRQEISPRAIARIMSNVGIVKVFDGGVDFEYRIAGDALVQAWRPQLSNRRFSDIAKEAPQIIARFREAFQRIVDTKEPMAVVASVGHDHPEARFVGLEAVLLPLGSDGIVRHVMTVSAFSYK